VVAVKEYIEKLIEDAFRNSNIVIWKDQERYFEEFFKGFVMKGVTNITYNNSITQLKTTVEKEDPFILNKYLIYVAVEDFDSDYEYFGNTVAVNLFDILNLRFGIKYSRDLYCFVNDYKGYIATNFEKLKEYHNGALLDVDGLKELVIKAIFELNHFNMDDLIIKLMFAPNRVKLFEMIKRPTLISFFYKQLEENYGIKLQVDSEQEFVDKISFAMLVNAYYYQADVKEMSSYESFIVSDEVKRERIFNFVDNVWRNNDKYKEQYVYYSNKYQNQFIETLPSISVKESIHINEYKSDIFIAVDEKLYDEVKRNIKEVIYSEGDTKLLDKVYATIKNRQGTFWSKNELFTKWTSIGYLIDFLYQYLDFSIQYKNKTYIKVEDLIKDYTQHLYKIDYNYRRFREVSMEIDIEGSLINKINQMYNIFLDDINYKYSLLIEKLDKYNIEGIANQQIVWDDFVKQQGKKCIIFVDALNYELGKELEEKLSQFETQNTIMVSFLPSITEVGMARLIMHRNEKLILKSENNGISITTDEYEKNLSYRDNRKEKMLQDIPDLDFKEISNILMQSTDNLNDNIAIFSRDIDNIGESGVSFAIEIFRNNIRDIIRVVNTLSNKGYTIFISSDHGFLYAVGNRPIKSPQGNYIRLSSRYGIGNNIQSEHIVKRSNWASIESDYNLVFARGIAEYSIKGGNEDFTHGGISLQENIIPYIKIKPIVQEKQDTIKYKFIVPEKIRSKIIRINIECDKENTEMELEVSLEGDKYNEKKNFSVQLENGRAEIKYRLYEKLPPNNKFVTIKIFDIESKLKLHESKSYVDLIDDKKLF
jgi:hypothetical protein